MITDKQTKSYLAENVSDLLDSRGWTQKQLADATGENQMMISRIVRGEHIPAASVLARIAEALDTTMDKLLEPPA